MTLRFASLPLRLSISICAVLLVFLGGAALLLGYLWLQRLTDRLNDQGLNTATETAYLLDRIFVQAEQAALTLATGLEQNPPPPETLPALLRRTIAAVNGRCAELNGLGIAYRGNGGLYAEYKSGDGFRSLHLPAGSDQADYHTRDWFTIPLALERPVWTVPYRSEMETHPLILSYAVPIFTGTGGERRSAGVVEVAIEIETLEKFLDNTALKNLRQLSREGEIFVMNQFGQFVLYPGREELLADTIFTLCDESEAPDPADRRAAQSVFRRPAGKIILNSVPRLMGGSELFYAGCTNGWVVGIVIPRNWELQYLTPAFIRFLLGTAVLLAAVVLIIFVLCRKLNAPLLLLSRAAGEIGKGNFDAPLPDFSRDDEVGQLSRSFRQMQTALADYIERLKVTVAARERSEGELSAAQAIQQDILPHILPPLPHCPNLVCAAGVIPARGVGGDLFDIFPIDEDHWALIIGDVSGKGIPAALFMAITQTLQRSIAQTEHTPEAIVTRLNKMLAKENTSEMFVTYWLGILDITNGELAFANGGHNPPLLRHADGTVEFLRQLHGPMLGIAPDRHYAGDRLTLAEGDMLILYTDGVTEAFNAADEMFGNDGLTAVVRAHPCASPEVMLHAIRDAVARHADGVEQADDITLLIVSYGRDRKEGRTCAAPDSSP